MQPLASLKLVHVVSRVHRLWLQHVALVALGFIQVIFFAGNYLSSTD